MAIVGHFDSLAEAQKLVQSVLLQGVVEEVIKDGHLLPKLPVTQINGKELTYNREMSVLPKASFVDIHEELAWSAGQTYSQVTVSLKRVARQDMLDNFIQKTYKDPNDYRAQVIREMTKICTYTIEEYLIYGDPDVNSKQIDGLWELVDSSMLDENNATGGALSLSTWRIMSDTMKLRPNFWLMPFAIGRRLDAYVQEAAVGAALGGLGWGPGDMGKPMMYFQGIPIQRTDWMLMTEGDSQRPTAYGGTGASNGSIFGIHLGALGQADAGVSLLVGGDTGGVEFFHMVELPELENYDASGIRMVAYCNLVLGSTKALGQLCNITDAAVTA